MPEVWGPSGLMDKHADKQIPTAWDQIHPNPRTQRNPLTELALRSPPRCRGLVSGAGVGGSGAHFSVVSLWGIGSFAGSSQERAAPRAREGARQSRRVRRAARLTAEAGGLAGKERRRGGWASRAEQSSFPRRPANPAGPLPPRRWLRRARESPAPRTAHRVAAAFHHCSFASPPAPTFPSLDSRAYTHTHTDRKSTRLNSSH